MTQSLSTRSRAGVRRGRRRVLGSTRSKGASLTWSAGWVDPVITLTPGVTGGVEAISNSEIRDTGENLTLVGGFIQVAGFVENGSANSYAGGYLIMGARTIPATITSVAETPDPFNESDGNWFWYRSFPLLDQGWGVMDGSNSFQINDQIRSARRLQQDEEVEIIYTWLDADLGAQDAQVRVLLSWRFLLRAP